MEMSGDVVAEFSRWFPERFNLDRNSYPTGGSKMCKDDISPSLFCKVPTCLKSDVSMERNEFNPKKNSLVFNNNRSDDVNRAQTDYVDGGERMFSAIQRKSEHALNRYLPVWKNSNVNGFQPGIKNLTNRNQMLNNNLTSAVTISDSSLDTYTSDSVHENTCSSLEEVFPLNPQKAPPPPRKLSKGEGKDLGMPELIPLICVEDDDPEKVVEEEEKLVKESKLTDSPEMPKLVAFSSEEAFRVKKEPADQCRVKLFDCETDSGVDSFLENLADRPQQLTEVWSSAGRSPSGGAMVDGGPRVLLRRMSLDGSSSTEELDDKLSLRLNDDDSDEEDSLTGPFDGKNSSNETPEIEEIEGVRFFQFRSKSDMEEFHEQVQAKVEDEEMIVPTKTTDITQIKGWRNKYFAPELEFEYPITLETVQEVADNTLQTSASGEAESVGKRDGTVDAAAGGETSSSPGDKAKDPEPLEDKKPSIKDLKIELKTWASNGKVPVIDLTTSNPESAFESKLLDDFLDSSSTLRVSYLEKLNPNIRPIPPNSEILGLGKLFKPESRVTTLAALKLRNGIALASEAKPEIDEKSSPDVEQLSSSSSSDADRSSDDDIPVARLHQRVRKRSRTGRPMPARRAKRIKSDVSSDQSQRVVLRLSRGESEGYKVSGITGEEKQEDSDALSSSTPTTTTSPTTSSDDNSTPSSSAPAQPAEPVPTGKLPILKHSLFVKVSESELLDEFLVNLNRLGTSNDVAMLMQSNQSYFEEGPVLTEEVCKEAVEALVMNEEQPKGKPSPKKKLKAWQRYLPKKLNPSLQQKISKLTKPKAHLPKVPASSESAPARNSLKTGKAKRFSKAKLKAKVVSSKKLSESVDNSLIEREKRSIRLPARYLDSAVLAAGTEWVSPVFVDEGEKRAARKHLLDVLEKMSPSKSDLVITQDLKTSTSSECILTKEPPSFLKKAAKSPEKEVVPCKKAKLSSSEPKKVNKGLANNRWRHQLRAIDAMVDSDISKDPYPFPRCPGVHCTRTLEFDRVSKNVFCTYDHSKASENNAPTRTLLCSESLPPMEKDETNDSVLKAHLLAPSPLNLAAPPPNDASNILVSGTSDNSTGVLPAPLMYNNGNIILTQQVNSSKGLQLAGDPQSLLPSSQILLLVPGPKPAPILPSGMTRSWATPTGTSPPKGVAGGNNLNSVWFVQDGELKSTPSLPVYRPLMPKPGQAVPAAEPIKQSRRRKSPLSKRLVLDDEESDLDVVTEDGLFDPQDELRRSFGLVEDFTNEECELVFAALLDESRSVSLDGKSNSEILLLIRSMEKLRSKSEEFKKARSCDEMLHMAQYVARETTKLERAYKCIKRVLRLRNIMLLRRANDILNGVKDIDASVVNKIKYELIRTLALEWETQKKDRSQILSTFRSQPASKGQSPVKKKQKKDHEFNEITESIELESSCFEEDNPAKNADASSVKKLFEPVAETEILEEPHVQLRILEAPESLSEIEAQFSVFEENMEVEKQPNPNENIMKTKVSATPSDGNISDDDLLIIDLSGEMSKENSPVKKPVNSTPSTSVDISPKSSKPAAPQKKFPGLIPIFKSDLLNDERIRLHPQGLGEKSNQTSPPGLASKCFENRLKKTTVSTKADGMGESASHLKHSASIIQGVTQNQETLQSDSNIFKPVGTSPAFCKIDQVVRNISTSGPHEEITIDDSDDEEIQDLSKRTLTSRS